MISQASVVDFGGAPLLNVGRHKLDISIFCTTRVSDTHPDGQLKDNYGQSMYSYAPSPSTFRERHSDESPDEPQKVAPQYFLVPVSLYRYNLFI